MEIDTFPTKGDVHDVQISVRNQTFSGGYYDLAEYNIWHMMIDKDRQGRGYGTAALQRCLEYIAKKPFGDSDRVVLTCHRENGAALALYRKFGFAETGNADDEEIELSMRVNH